MDDHEAEIERLKAAIAQKETLLAELETEIIDLERDLQPVIDRYNRIIAPKVTRLDILKQMITDLETDLAARSAPPPAAIPTSPYTTWKPPDDYVPVEEQFRRTWQTAPDQPDMPPHTAPSIIPDRPTGAQASLKQLYRSLVRRYHPDLAADPDERERRNRLMAEINAAYANGDLDALQALTAQEQNGPIDEPLKQLQLRQLQQVHEQLITRIAHLQHERHTLLNGDMMWIKVQHALGAREGRDYLQEMAAHLDAEYATYLDRLDELKRQF